MKEVYIINERGPNFWGTHKIAEKTTFGKMDHAKHIELSSDEFDKFIGELSGKRILVYVHGLKNTEDDVFSNYTSIRENISNLSLSQSYYSRFKNLMKSYLGFPTATPEMPYDVIIGYSWPSYDHESYYFDAKKHAKELAPRFSKHIEKLSQSAKKLDIMAHSMGNLLLFESLSKHPSPKIKIDHIYSIAPAVPNTCLNPEHPFSNTLNVCNLLFVFHTKNDYALGWPYYLAEKQTYALGLVGPHANENLKLHPKVKSIDSTQAINGHSAYFTSDDFYKYLLKIHNQELDFEKSHFEMSAHS